LKRRAKNPKERKGTEAWREFESSKLLADYEPMVRAKLKIS